MNIFERVIGCFEKYPVISSTMLCSAPLHPKDIVKIANPRFVKKLRSLLHVRGAKCLYARNTDFVAADSRMPSCHGRLIPHHRRKKDHKLSFTPRYTPVSLSSEIDEDDDLSHCRGEKKQHPVASSG